MQKKRVILFLSTGNICRSPMALGYFTYLLQEKKIKHIEIRSAGVMTIPGLLPTQESMEMLEPYAVDLTKHRSVQLTKDMIKKADLILGMSPFHVQSALRESDQARDKTFLLKEYTKSDLKNYQISDPMGCTLEIYKKVFNEIKNACNKLLQIEMTCTKPGKRGRKKKPGTEAPLFTSPVMQPSKETDEEDIEQKTEEAKSKLQNIFSKFKSKDSKIKAKIEEKRKREQEKINELLSHSKLITDKKNDTEEKEETTEKPKPTKQEASAAKTETIKEKTKAKAKTAAKPNGKNGSKPNEKKKIELKLKTLKPSAKGAKDTKQKTPIQLKTIKNKK